jgi:hypothetical protein
MNSTQPRVKTCPCGQQFTLSARNQLYCQPCREARAAAMEAVRVKACRHCNVVKTTNHGICQECREADKQRRQEEAESKAAAKLARFNANGGCTCGRLATNPDTGLCDDCHKQHRIKQRQELRERRREAYERYRRDEAAAPEGHPALICNECGQNFRPVGIELHCQACMDADNDEFMAWFNTLSEEEQTERLDFLRQWCADHGIKLPDEETDLGADQEPPAQPRPNEEAAPKGLPRWDDDNERHGGRYGFGCRLPKAKAQEETPNPEQVDAANQDAIDAAFAAIMKGIEL